jgi:hypothetical protein
MNSAYGGLRPRIWASSGVAPCDVPLEAQHPVVARWQAHLHGLETAIHETSGLGDTISEQEAGNSPVSSAQSP